MLIKQSGAFKLVPIGSVPQTARFKDLLAEHAKQPTEYPYAQITAVGDKKSEKAYADAFHKYCDFYHLKKSMHLIRSAVFVAVLTAACPYHLAGFAVSSILACAHVYRVLNLGRTRSNTYYRRTPARLLSQFPYSQTVTSGIIPANSRSLTKNKHACEYFSHLLSRGYDLYLDAVKLLYTHEVSAAFFADKFMGPPHIRVVDKFIPPQGCIYRAPPFMIELIDAPITATAPGARSRAQAFEYMGELVIPFFPRTLDANGLKRLRSASEVMLHEENRLMNQYRHDIRGKRGAEVQLAFYHVEKALAEAYADMANSLAAGRVVVKFSAGYCGSEGSLCPLVPLLSDDIRVQYTDEKGQFYEAHIDRVVGRAATLPDTHPLATGAIATLALEQMRKNVAEARKADKAPPA
jgi:hypothetical protein